jgi:hypothetical protein
MSISSGGKYMDKLNFEIKMKLMVGDKEFELDNIIEIKYLYDYTKTQNKSEEVFKTIKGRLIDFSKTSLALDVSNNFHSEIINISYATIYEINKK